VKLSYALRQRGRFNVFKFMLDGCFGALNIIIFILFGSARARVFMHAREAFFSQRFLRDPGCDDADAMCLQTTSWTRN
jgi:hypothetical protein